MVPSSLAQLSELAVTGHTSQGVSAVSLQPHKCQLHKWHHQGSRGPFPAVNDEDVIIILHQQQTMHVAHNIPNTNHTFSEETQKGSLCTYSALCSITWHRDPWACAEKSCALDMLQVGQDQPEMEQDIRGGLKELSWPSIRDHHIFLTFCQIFKIVHFLDCINFESYFSYSSRPSRSHNQTICCVPSRLNCFRFSFFYQCSLFVEKSTSPNC